jgi:hypothetical protein
MDRFCFGLLIFHKNLNLLSEFFCEYLNLVFKDEFDKWNKWFMKQQFSFHILFQSYTLKKLIQFSLGDSLNILVLYYSGNRVFYNPPFFK